MAIDGVIILDNTGRPIIQSGFRSSQPAYPMLHIDALVDALAKAARPSDVDPVLYVPAHNLDGPTACCHMQVGGMRFLCPISGDLDPVYAFSFLQTFIDILTEYFGSVTAPTLRDNFDVIYQLLEETLDAIGHPLTTSPNALRDIVLPPSLLSKILSVAGATGLASTSQPNPFASAIPWRRTGVRYTNNEIYFDIVEDLRAIVNKAGTPLSSNVWGKIEANSKLSGTPDLILSFTNVQSVSDVSFHPCVRLQRWTRDKSLSFVPPDGRFTLMEYHYTPSPPSAAITAPQYVPLPLQLKPTIHLDETGGKIDIVLSSRTPGRALENVTIELILGVGSTSVSCQASGNSSWTFDSRRQTLRWEVPSLTNTVSPTLRGTFSSTTYPRPARALQVRFSAQAHSFSALKVDQLRLTGEAYKPFKGVRSRATGVIEWRW